MTSRFLTSLQIFIACVTFCFGETNEKNEGHLPVNFDPVSLLKIPEGTTVSVRWNTTLFGVEGFRITIEDDEVSVVDEGALFEKVSTGNLTARGEFNVTTKILGYNTIRVALLDRKDVVLAVGNLNMTVVIPYQTLNSHFTTSIGVLLALLYVNMGATIDFNVVKQISQRPIGPILGILCQFGGMPLIAFGLSMWLYQDDPLLRIGLFMAGCVPGGGASNMWTHLLGGSLDLSIMMTFASTIVAFAALPAWLYGLGPIVTADAQFYIPYVNITIIAVGLIVPCSIGLLIQRFLPRVQKFLQITLTPFSLAILVYIFTFGVYSNLFIFHFFSLKVVLSGFALPTIGYLTGIFAATCFGLPWKDRIAIGIETGIQNMSIAIFVLNFTLDQPAGNLAIVIPGAAVLTCPIPLALAYIVKIVYERCNKSESMDIITKGDKAIESGTHYGADKNTSSRGIELADGKGGMKIGIDNPAAELSD